MDQALTSVVFAAPEPVGATALRPRRLGPVVRGGLLVSASAGAVVALMLAVPSLADVGHRLTSVDGWWLASAVALEVGSCVSFVVVFRAFFDRVPGNLARRIAWVEMASGALLPGGGVTSYALGGLLLSRAGMDRRSILVRSGGVFWLTSAVNAVAVLVGASLLLGARSSHSDIGRSWLPVLIVTPLSALIAASPWLVRRRPSLMSRAWLVPLVDGVADAWRAARQPSWRLLGALGYLGLDIAVLLCLFRGLGYDANVGALMLGYLVGYTATLIPIPAGIGVLEGGMAGALVLYGTPPATTAAAVLLYHAIAFWIPSLGGTGAWTALLLQSRNEQRSPASRPHGAHKQLCGHTPDERQS
jgi:uncharacterized membrane protein YbhN (UPF0104 family)